MKNITKTWKHLNFPINPAFCSSEYLYFDIETTGLSASSSSLYLIGILFYEEDHFTLKQWFCETLSDEQTALSEFLSFASQFRTLIHFNGTSFDLPYLKRCARQYHIPFSLNESEQIDLFLKLRKYKYFLDMDKTSLKDFENRFGLEREDLYSGGDLIKVYQDYLKTPLEETLAVLLLHNEEDLLSLPLLVNALSYDIENHPGLSFQKMEQKNGRLELTYSSFSFLPADIKKETDTHILLDWNKERILLCFPVIHKTLKTFLPDYKNYYYLPAEDTAIHKSLGEYVDHALRKKAKASTCFQKAEDDFIPVLTDSDGIIFQPEYHSPDCYIRIHDDILKDDEKREQFIRHILDYFLCHLKS